METLEERAVPAAIPLPDHVVIVVEENHSYAEVMGAASPATYIKSLASGPTSALFTQSYAIEHPSQPNYLDLFSGSNQGVTTDATPTNVPFTTPNLGAALLAKGYSFAGYSEDLPSVGSTVTASGAYARKHNPWVNWQGNGTNGLPATANQPLTAFPTDYTALPTVSFVIPNQDNDMHNGSDPLRVATADTWLQNHLDGYIQWAKTHNSLFILTFDEDDSSASNQITTIFVGPMVQAGQYSQVINHYTVLRTLEEMYGTTYSGAAAAATAITSVWKPDTAAQTKFVQALYTDALHRTGSTSEINAWVNVLNSPGGSQSGVANGIERSVEARNVLVRSWYTTYLNRAGSDPETLAWANMMVGPSAKTEEQVLSSILGSQEFSNRAQTLIPSGTTQERYVNALYSLLLGRTPAAAETAAWVNVLPSVGNSGAASGIVQSFENRLKTVNGYYQTLLHRSADSAGANSWANSGLDFTSIRVGIEGSAEFFVNG